MKPCFRILLGMSLCSVLPGAPQDAGPGATKSDVGSETQAVQERSNGSSESGRPIASVNEASQATDQPMCTLRHPVIDLGIVCREKEAAKHRLCKNVVMDRANQAAPSLRLMKRLRQQINPCAR